MNSEDTAIKQTPEPAELRQQLREATQRDAKMRSEEAKRRIAEVLQDLECVAKAVVIIDGSQITSRIEIVAV